MALRPGTRLGTYEVLGPIGAGGMGEVYRAKDLRLGRDVAVKVLPEDVASHPERLARFEREARTVAGLNHPNIITLYSIEDEDGVRFLTMELVDGRPLSNLLAPGGLPLAHVLDLAIPLADALVAAHERGVVHRDLKPANVMVTRDGRVKVLDFGLARTVVDEKAGTFTTTADEPLSEEGRIQGTAPYMAPEQVRGEIADARSDLFALGIILYELATDRRPFTGSTRADVSSSILRDSPDPISRARPDLPIDFERIVGRCLEKNVRDRVQTALDVSNELRRLRRSLDGVPAGQPGLSGVASVAVLPFVNRSRDEADEYFSDGLADELLNVLAKIRGVRVAARTSAFTFKGKDATIADIGAALNVATVLEGSVRKAGNRVRISVQLVKVSDGYHMWSETYDRTLDDIFAVQDEIAHAVVKELRATLLGQDVDSDASGRARAEVADAVRGRGTDPEAHRLYLLARHFADRWTREDTAKGIAHLRQALDRDPGFALAWAELGRGLAREADFGWVPMAEGYDRARAAVERSLALEPNLAEAHEILGWIRVHHHMDWAAAEECYRRGLELAPDNVGVLNGAGMMAANAGRIDEAIELYHRALERDPLSAIGYHRLAYALHAADRFTEAEHACRKALELAPNRILTRAALSLALSAQGRNDDALAEAEREPEEGFRLYALAIIHHAMGHGAESDRALDTLTRQYADGGAYQIAEVCAARGDADAAFEWLERAHGLRDPGLMAIKSCPRLRPLHGDARWAALLRRVGFEP